MTAPIWMAAPPEVHAALLSSGPGAGPLLATATAWQSLSVEYTETATELAELLATVQGGAWGGPTAAAYAAAHMPYLAWLARAGADSAIRATQHEIAATAWSIALATMPTLPELAANHSTHAVLAATNFFGMNTIPIALNEADYMRMWVQAATVMGTYQSVSAAALAATPDAAPAPEIVKAELQQVGSAETTPLQEQLNQFLQWLWQLYTRFYNEVIQPFNNWLANLPFFQALFSGFDPYLVSLGNPLTYFSPLNIAFALGYPMDIGTYVALLSQMFSFVALDLTAAFASGNPLTIGFTIMFVTVEVIGTVVTDTIALLKTTLESTLALVTVLVPLITAPLVTLAAGAVLAPIGVKGLVALAVPPPPPPVTPAPTPLAALAPNAPTSGPSPTPSGMEASAPTGAPGSPPPSTAAPPTVTGTGMPAHMDLSGYLVGDLSSAAKRAAATGARKKAPEPDSAEEPAPAPAPEEPVRAPRRRRAKAPIFGRGYEYLDFEPDDPVPASISEASGASDRGARTLGFAGTVATSTAGAALGLASLADDGFGGRPRTPMVPGTWAPDPEATAQPGSPPD